MPHPLSHKYPIPISQLCLVNTDVPAGVGAPPLDTTPGAPRVATPMRYTLYQNVCSKMFCGLVWSVEHTSRELKSLHTRVYGVWNRILAITEHIYCIADRFRSLVLTLEIYTELHKYMEVYFKVLKLY